MHRLVFSLVFCALAADAAHAGEHRVALLVAHPLGDETLAPLRYTRSDLDRVREVLLLWGGFAKEDIVVSYQEDAAEVQKRFVQARRRLAENVGAPGSGTLFLFYYSGHTQNEALQLGETRLPLSEITSLLDSTNAQIRLALIDSCRAGAITRIKGATKGEPIRIAVDTAQAQAGQVLITASSADEDAQESDEIQGSFFTHFLTTGLRGAADEDSNGQVTLSEAYAFAYNNTVTGTMGSRSGAQHPTYLYDIRGAGDLVLTRPGNLSSAIEFPANVSGRFLVFDAKRRAIVAELTKEEDRLTRLAVAPGRYVVKRRLPDHLQVQTLVVAPLQTAVVDSSRMEQIALGDDHAKGAVVRAEDILFGPRRTAMSLGLGPQIFLSAPARLQFFPTSQLWQMRFDFANALRRHLGFNLDVGWGTTGQRALVINDRFVGESRFKVLVNTLTAGGGLRSQLPLTDWLDLGGTVRLGFIVVSRHFVEPPLADQGFSTLVPGLGLDLTAQVSNWLQAGVGVRGHYMFFNVDKPMSLAYLDAGAFFAVMFR